MSRQKLFDHYEREQAPPDKSMTPEVIGDIPVSEIDTRVAVSRELLSRAPLPDGIKSDLDGLFLLILGIKDGAIAAIDRTRKESEKRIKELEAQVLTMEVTEAEGDRVAKSMMDAAREQGRKEERERDKYRAMEEYIVLLEEESRDNSGFLYAHGITASDEKVKRGEELRRRISEGA